MFSCFHSRASPRCHSALDTPHPLKPHSELTSTFILYLKFLIIFLFQFPVPFLGLFLTIEMHGSSLVLLNKFETAVYKKRRKTRLRKPEAMLRQKIKFRHQSGLTLMEIQTQVITRWKLDLMKHSTFSKYLCQKLESKLRSKQ